jgi:hypothetical protein
MGIDSHLSTCVGTQSPKYLEMAQRHISLSLPPFLFICRWIVQNYTIQRQIKINGGSRSLTLLLVVYSLMDHQIQ